MFANAPEYAEVVSHKPELSLPLRRTSRGDHETSILDGSLAIVRNGFFDRVVSCFSDTNFVPLIGDSINAGNGFVILNADGEPVPPRRLMSFEPFPSMMVRLSLALSPSPIQDMIMAP